MTDLQLETLRERACDPDKMTPEQAEHYACLAIVYAKDAITKGMYQAARSHLDFASALLGCVRRAK